MTKLLAATCLLLTPGWAAAAITYGGQELMSNPFMTAGSYVGWSPNTPWRNDGGAGRQVFDLTETGATGFFLTSQATVDLKTTGDHATDPSFSLGSAELSALTFNGVFIESFNAPAAGAGLDARLFIELDLNTTAGTYRAKSVEVADVWTQSGVVLDQASDYTWETGAGFLGDPFLSGGVSLADLLSIDVKNVLRVETNNASGSGTVFTTLDNASIGYAVAVIPEASSLLAWSAMALGATLRSRRRE